MEGVYLDHHSHYNFLQGAFVRPRWLEDMFKFPALIALNLVCIYKRFEIESLVLLLILSRVDYVQHLITGSVEQTKEMNKRMKKVQKLINLENTIQEREEGSIEVPESWPKSGDVKAEGVKLRYRPKCDLSLKGLTFDIRSGLKVGVVGRTGAGKSTLGLTFLRILELESGNITIDGVDISKVKLQTLR